MPKHLPKNQAVIGVGLRHPHFEEALVESSNVDFIEVHSENFFAHGGALHQIITDIADKYPISLHSTAMGLGSASGIPELYLQNLVALVSRVKPFLISDHAAFAWGDVNGQLVHAGDLLPLVYNEENLAVMAKHIDQIQQRLGRALLVENLSAYITLSGSTMSEQSFLSKLTEITECGLLIDLNNILVNAYNQEQQDPLEHAKAWLTSIPNHKVGEIHLAGFTVPSAGSMAIDDHSQAVSQTCWQLYEYSLQKFGAVPTLIEWDNQLPPWQTLVEQADKARHIAQQVFADE